MAAVVGQYTDCFLPSERRETMPQTAVIAGVGPGLSASIARTFAQHGCNVALFARSEDYIEELADDLPEPGDGLAVQTDLSDVEAIEEGFETVRDEFGGCRYPRQSCECGRMEGTHRYHTRGVRTSLGSQRRGAFLCSREAVDDMLDNDGGTIIFTGATSAVRSLGGTIGFTAAKFAARGMAMDIAQEFGPQGIHVAHVVLDGRSIPQISELVTLIVMRRRC